MPDPQPSVFAGIFGRPFREQVAFFRQKLGNLIPTRRWDELDGAAHDRGFTVAGAMKADLLADLAAAVDRAIAEGRGLEEFRRDFMEIVRRRGWTGFTGDRTPAGRAWRTRVIYATNAATSYAAGRMAQLREAGFPIWIYRHSHLSREPRPHHLAWDGSAVPADDPWWRTHSPPNGWGCRCYVVGAANERAARAMGAKRFGAPTAPADRTGIDRGWDHAPGATVVDTVAALRDKLETLPAPIGSTMLREWAASMVFARWFADPRGDWPLARMPDEDAARIGAAGHVVWLSADTARKQAERHPDLEPVDYALVQDVLSKSDIRLRDTPRTMVYVGTEDGGSVVVVKATRTGERLFLTSLRRLSRDAASRDREIRRLLRRRREE